MRELIQPDAGWRTEMSESGGKYDGFVPLESLDPEARKLVEMLQHQIELLREKLKESCPESDEKEYTLEEARAGLNDAVSRLMSGEESAQADFDKWDKIISEHPDHLAKLARERVEWEENQAGQNEAALAITKGYVPANIKSISVAALKASGLPTDLAKRVFTQKALWLVRLPQTAIAKLHIVDLKTKYSSQGLDLIELRAVYYSLPAEFENDPSGEKQQWRETLRRKLEMCVKEDSTGKLSTCKFRHACYIDLNKRNPVDMPFDALKDLTDELREGVDALLVRAVQSVQKLSRPKRPTATGSSSTRIKSRIEAKANLAALLAARPKGGAHSLRKPAKQSGKTAPPVANALQDLLLKRKNEGSSPSRMTPPRLHAASLSRKREASRSPSELNRRDAQAAKPSPPAPQRFEDKIAQFEARLFPSSPLKDAENRTSSTNKVNKLNISDDFRRKLVTIQSSSPKKAEVTCAETEWAEITATGDDTEVPHRKTPEPVEDKEWQALERSLCLQERPLKEQVNVLERLLHTLVSSSMYRKRRPNEHKMPVLRSCSSLSDPVEVIAECNLSPLATGVKDTLHMLKVDSPTVQKTLDNLKTAFSKSMTSLGIPQKEQPSSTAKSLACPVVLENSKDADWLIVNKN